MVLGVQWLQQWGPITWDFQNLTMKFKMGSKTVLLHGIQQHSVREARANKINKRQSESVHLSMICTQFIDESVQSTLCSVEVAKTEPELPTAVQSYSQRMQIFLKNQGYFLHSGLITIIKFR